jgi:hypothetical protein
MADEVLDGAPEGAAEVTDLRSTIVAAIEQQRTPDPELPIRGPDTPDPVEGKVKFTGETIGEKPETEAERNERLRDKSGKFATEKNAVKRDEPEVAKGEVAKPVEGEAPKPDAPSDQPALRPPPGWSPTAKVAFDKLPPEVQQAVANREIEVNKGFAKFQEYKPIDRYMDMAKQSGTTLDKALENYVGIENRLRQDFPTGIAELCQRQGVHPVALAQAILARHGAPSQQDASGDQTQVRQPASIDPAVLQRMNALEAQVRQQAEFVQNQQNQGVQTEIQRFASNPEHKFFENVKADMGRLINSGQAEDLDDAYDKACWANKEIRALLIKQQSAPSANAADAVQRAKAAAKATGGAPSAGFKPNAGSEGGSIRDTIRAAVNSQRGI